MIETPFAYWARHISSSAQSTKIEACVAAKNVTVSFEGPRHLLALGTSVAQFKQREMARAINNKVAALFVAPTIQLAPAANLGAQKAVLS